MTSINDHDRVLGAWLDDGPNRAPDRPIELAIDHARAHPRRRDPLGFLRPDPMGRRTSGPAPRPVMVLGVLGLLLAAVVAVGVGGPTVPAIVAPPTASQPNATPAPSTSQPPSAPIFHVALTVPAGQAQTVEVIDGSGLVDEAMSGAPSGETGQNFPFESVEVSNLDPTTLQLAWAGFPCRTDHTLTIQPDGRSMSLQRPACVGDTDTIGIDRILVLHFSEPVAAEDVTVSLMP
jgi:hypothetical protein